MAEVARCEHRRAHLEHGGLLPVTPAARTSAAHRHTTEVVNPVARIAVARIPILDAQQPFHRQQQIVVGRSAAAVGGEGRRVEAKLAVELAVGALLAALPTPWL